MNLLQLMLRLVHIVGGAYWVGAVIFNAAFLFPAMRDAGPDAAKVSAGILKRRFADITPIVALLTIGSGVWLYARASVGFDLAYMQSRTGIAYAIGGSLAIVAFVIGWFAMRASLLRAVALAQRAPMLDGAERERALTTAAALRARAGAAGNVVAWLLTAAVTAMAIARYLP